MPAGPAQLCPPCPSLPPSVLPAGQGWASRGAGTPCLSPQHPTEGRRGSTGLCWQGFGVPGSDGGQVSLTAACQGVTPPKRAQHPTQQGCQQAWSPVQSSTQNPPEKHSQPCLFSLPHTLQHISLPPQQGERYTSMILFHFCCWLQDLAARELWHSSQTCSKGEQQLLTWPQPCPLPCSRPASFL